MNILIIGASGFVGQNVKKVFSSSKEFNLFFSSYSLGVDLIDYAQTEALLKKTAPDYIINCAAHVGSLNYVTEKAANVMLDNSRMLLNMYEAVSKICPKAIIINPIANCAYPAKADTFIEDFWMEGHLHRSVLSYGSTRRLLWSIAESFYMQHAIKTINLFVPNMYGPYDSPDPNKAHALDALISKFVKAQKENIKEIEIWGTGVAIREWLYAEDFGKIILQVISEKNIMGLSEPINIGQNFGLSVRELVEIIQNHFDNKFIIKWNHNMPDGAPKKVMDDRKFRKVFPDFKFTDFNTGIEQTINYYNAIYPY